VKIYCPSYFALNWLPFHKLVIELDRLFPIKPKHNSSKANNFQFCIVSLCSIMCKPFSFLVCCPELEFGMLQEQNFISYMLVLDFFFTFTIPVLFCTQHSAVSSDKIMYLFMSYGSLLEWR
jgi:hypothetical protein